MAAGFSPELFWKITPREMKAHFAGAAKRLAREHDDRAWLAWHTAALPLSKKFPELKQLQVRREAPRKTWQEQLAAVRGWAER